MKKSFEPSWIDKNFEISSLLQDVPIGQLFVLTDTNSAKYCLPLFAEFIGEIPYNLHVVKAGEEYKNIVSVQVVWDFLFKHHATREAIIINLGGGEPITLKRMIETIEETMGKKAIKDILCVFLSIGAFAVSIILSSICLET